MKAITYIRIIALFAAAVLIITLTGCGKVPEEDPMEAVMGFLDGCAAEEPMEEVSPSDQTEKVPEQPLSATITMAGDCLLHENLCDYGYLGDDKYSFEDIIEFSDGFFSADLNIVNMETPVDAFGDNKRVSSYPAFNAPIELLDVMAEMGVDVCSTANNHALDMGWDGLVNTLYNLESYGIEGVGTNRSAKERDSLFICESGGIKIGIAAFTQTTNGVYLDEEKEQYAISRFSCAQDILPQVSRLREGGAEYIIIILHWGNEYRYQPTEEQRTIAQELCNGGVDAIMGCHPHVVQPIERLQSTADGDNDHQCLVIYSLGNFFCNQRIRDAYTRQSMTVSIRIERGEDGIVRMTDGFYMPVMMYSYKNAQGSCLRLIPVGRYLSEQFSQDLFSTKEQLDYAQESWNHIVNTVGDELDVVACPEEYPRWMPR